MCGWSYQGIHNRLDHRIRFRLHFRIGGILYRMGHEDATHLWQTQGFGLGLRRIDERARRQKHRGLSVNLKPDAIVHTARCARPSVSQGFDDEARLLSDALP